jgi:hypothetical protein
LSLPTKKDGEPISNMEAIELTLLDENCGRVFNGMVNSIFFR